MIEFDEAAAIAQAKTQAQYSDEKSIEAVMWAMYVEGAKWQHSLMQERLEAAKELASTQSTNLARAGIRDVHKDERIAQLSATCERYRAALEECDRVMTRDFHEDVCLQSRSCHCSPTIARKALESGERKE